MLLTFFFFNDTATTEIYTLSLHDALPILGRGREVDSDESLQPRRHRRVLEDQRDDAVAPLGEIEQLGHLRLLRSEEHTSELQSRQYLVCRLLLEKKKKNAHGTT